MGVKSAKGSGLHAAAAEFRERLRMIRGRSHMKRVGKFLINVDVIISCLALIILIYVTFSNVILRYCFNSPYQWGEEVQMILIVWLIWFGGSAAFRTGNQICVDMILGLLPKGIQKMVGVVIYLLSVAVLLFLVKQGISYVAQLASTNRVTETLHIPRALIYSCMPISSFLMACNMTWAEIQEWRGGNKE